MPIRLLVANLWWRLFWLSHRRLSAQLQTSTSLCANRWTRVMRVGSTEVSVTCRDTSEPDGYARDELVEMLHRVRYHERAQGWIVPEPVIDATAGSPHARS